MTLRRFSRLHLVWLGMLCAAAAVLFAQEAAEVEKAEAMVREVSGEVAKLRGLAFKEAVALKVSTRDEVEKFVVELLEKEWPRTRMDLDARAFQTLGLLPEGYDLHAELVALYREQVAGLYDPEGRRMILVDIDLLKGLTKMVLSHELTHALQDQQFDLGGRMKRSSRSLDEDWTISSVAEGDATILMSDYMMRHALDDPKILAEAMKADVMAASAKLLSAPPLLQHLLLSPYFRGMSFVGHFRSRGGWKRVNEIYGDFPLSSEQVLHPQKYYPRRDIPKRVEIDRTRKSPLNLNWGSGTETTIGEIGVIAMVETWGLLLDDAELKASAERLGAGWDGDLLVSWESPDGSRRTVCWISTWDTPGDATELREGLNRWAEHWKTAEKDPARSRLAIVRQDEEAGEPGRDVVCILVSTPGEPAEFTWLPRYTKSPVRGDETPDADADPGD